MIMFDGFRLSLEDDNFGNNYLQSVPAWLICQDNALSDVSSK